MNNSTIVFLINDDVRAFAAQYEDGGKTEIFKTLDDSISVDDLVVVQSGTRHKMTVVKVTETDVEVNFDSTVDVRWAVQRIDHESFEGILAQEGEAVLAVQVAERRRKKAELRAAMLKDHEESIAHLAIANHSEADVTE